MASNKRPRSLSPSPTTSPDAEAAVKVADLSCHSVRKHVISCTLPHVDAVTLSFPSYLAYEEHYASCHTNKCLSPGCYRNFPSSHYLSLHIAENHDPIAEARKARGDKVYACFVEDCDRMCRDWKKRRAHLVDKHGFPRDYDFLVINTGIDGRRSMLRTLNRGSYTGIVLPEAANGHACMARNCTPDVVDTRSGAAGLVGTGADTGESESNDAAQASRRDSARLWKQPDTQRPADMYTHSLVSVHPSSSAMLVTEVDGLTQSMSALRFVPPSVRFGRGGARGGLARK